MIQRTAVAILVASLAKAENEPKEISFRPLTERFAVLGTTKGSLVVEGDTGCIATGPITFKLPSGAIVPVQLTSIHFGIAVAIERND